MKVLRRKTVKSVMLAVVFLTAGNQTMFGQEVKRKLRIVRPLPANFVVPTTMPESSTRVERSKQRLSTLMKSGEIKRLLSDKQIAALIQVECSGRNGLVGDKHLGVSGQAYGMLQIRRCYVKDVNEKYGTDLRATDCQWDRELSELITQAYMTRYAKSHFSFEHFARMHNGGPSGWNPKFPTTYKKTTIYWAKVQSKLAIIVAKN